jgi:hypothetical protein
MASVEEGSKDDKKEEKAGSGRWWEFYFVRYALGTVFGVLIVRFLAGHGLNIPFPDGAVTEIANPEGMPLLLAYGLAYCYLASAPILLFHAARFGMQRKGVPWRTILFALLSTAAMLIWLYKVPNLQAASERFVLAAGVTLVFVIFILLSQLWAIYLGTTRAREMWAFYVRLDKNRRIKANKELVDSYRHLREHGNAFSVVMLEMLLGAALYFATRISIFPAAILPDCAIANSQCNATDSIAVIQSFVLLLLWILPAASVWGIGCYLEAQFADDPNIGAQTQNGTTSAPPAP